MKRAYYCRKSGQQVICHGQAEHPDTKERVVVYEVGLGVLRYMHPREFHMGHSEIPLFNFGAIRKEET